MANLKDFEKLNEKESDDFLDRVHQGFIEFSFTLLNIEGKNSRIENSLYQRINQNIPLISELIRAFQQRKISNTDFKEIFLNYLHSGPATVQGIIELIKHKSESKQDDNALAPLAMDAIAANPIAVADVKKGNDKAINAIVGHVIKALKANGKSADPAVIQKVVRAEIAREKL